jgi:hypothetical protein
MSNFARNKKDKCKGEYLTAVHHMQKTVVFVNFKPILQQLFFKEKKKTFSH